MQQVKDQFLDAVCEKIGYGEDQKSNYFLFGEVKDITDCIRPQDYEAFIKALSNYKQYHKGIEKLKAVYDQFTAQYKSEVLGIDKEQFAYELEAKIERVDYIAHKQANGLSEYRSKIDSLKAEDIKNQDNAPYFDEKQLYIIQSIGSIQKCFSLITEGYSAFKTRVLVELNRTENEKAQKVLKIGSEKPKVNHEVLNRLEIKK